MNHIEIASLLLKLLRKKDIYVNEKDFFHFIKSHPQYPQLISVTDTLDYFEIEYGLYQTESVNEVEESIDSFLALLVGSNNTSIISLIEKKNLIYKVNSKKTPFNIIEKFWGGIVLVLEENRVLVKKKKKKKVAGFIGIIFALLSVIYLSNFDYKIIVFYLLSGMGLFLSTVALKDVFGFKNTLSEKICVTSRKIDCETVIQSKKWKIFKYLDFSDLSLIFFSSQLILGFITASFNYLDSFFVLQYVTVLLSIPVITLSLFYQKFIIKKWCSICLGISLVLILELIYFVVLYTTRTLSFDIDLFVTFFSILLFVWIYFLWRVLKALLIKYRLLMSKDLVRNQVLLKYTTFKTLLKNSRYVNTDLDFVNLNSLKKPVNFTLITDPFCDYCKDTSEQLESLFKQVDGELSYNVVFNIDMNDESKLDKSLYRNMMNIQKSGNPMLFRKAMKDWYEVQDVDLWLKKYADPTIDKDKIDEIIENQHQWCLNVYINYTPALIINNYVLPKIYEAKDLTLIVGELLEDNDMI